MAGGEEQLFKCRKCRSSKSEVTAESPSREGELLISVFVLEGLPDRQQVTYLPNRDTKSSLRQQSATELFPNADTVEAGQR